MTSEISATQLSHEVLYISFRAAWLSTFESLVSEIADRKTSCAGFLNHIPLLAGVAPQVQLDCLFQTWQQLNSGKNLSLFDHAVCVAATHELARLGEIEHSRRLNKSFAGPNPLDNIDRLWLASKIRTQQITLPIRSDAMPQFQMLSLTSSNLDQIATEQSNSELRGQSFDVLARWRVSAEILANSQGLLEDSEVEMLRLVFADNRGMQNL